jgi:hypothetical protein
MSSLAVAALPALAPCAQAAFDEDVILGVPGLLRRIGAASR